MSRMKIVAILAGLGAAGLLAASAATLGGLNTADLGADTTVVAACQTTGQIAADYTTTYEPALVVDTVPDPDVIGGYVVDTVTISNLNASCFGQAMDVTLADDTGASLATATIDPIDAASEDLDVSGDDVSAIDVTRIAIVITGRTAP